jgi:uncharacterized protein HemY
LFATSITNNTNEMRVKASLFSEPAARQNGDEKESDTYMELAIRLKVAKYGITIKQDVLNQRKSTSHLGFGILTLTANHCSS